jgi:uncharacterized delta-60 repeat protein
MRLSLRLALVPSLVALLPHLAGCGGDDDSSTITTSDASVGVEGTLTASPATLSLAPGQSVTVNVTLSGAKTPAALSVANLPLGVAASFDPPTSDTTSVLTLTTGGDVTAATTSILLHASGLEFDAIASVGLSIATPDSGTDAGATDAGDDAADSGATASFSVVAVPSALSIAQGQSAPASVNVVRSGGFSGPVDLSFPALPAGVTVTPATLTLPAGATSGTVTVQVAATTPTGALSLAVHGVSDALTSDSAIALTVPQPMGGVDTTFGTAGTGSSVVAITENGLSFTPTYAALQSTGAIVVAGSFGQFGFGSNNSGGVVRLTANGELDTTFGGGSGYALSPVTGTQFNQIAIQGDDAVVVTYESTSGSGAAGAVRFLANGAVDTSFGSGGAAAVSGIYASLVALQANGQIIVAGQANTSPYGIAAGRLTTGGALDTTYGSNGIARIASTASPAAILQTTAGLVIEDYASVNNISSVQLLRLTSTGALDATFGTAGFLSPFGTATASSPSLQLAVDATGRLVLPVVGNNVPGVIRVTGSGTLDTTFGAAMNGFAPQPYASSLGTIAVTASGTILLGGVGTPAQGQTDEVAARLLATGVTDTTFNGTGHLFVSPDPASSSSARSILPLADGRFLVVATVGLNSFAVTRFYP